MKAFAEANQMAKEFEELNEQLNIRTDYDGDDYMKPIKRVSESQINSHTNDLQKLYTCCPNR